MSQPLTDSDRNLLLDAAKAGATIPGAPSYFVRQRITEAREVLAASRNDETKRAYLAGKGSIYARAAEYSDEIMAGAFLGWTLATLSELISAVEIEAQIGH